MLEIFQYDFMQRALVAGLITAIIAPLVGIFLVVRRYSLIVDTLAHVSLLGIVLGMLTPFNPYLFSTGFTMLASLGIEKVKDYSKLYQEAVLAMFLSGSLALSLVIISVQTTFNVNIFSLLFGSINTVTNQDLINISFLALVVIIAILAMFKQLFLISYDEDIAIAAGIKTKVYNALLILIAAITISLSIRIIGVLLISALMVVPVITAINFKQSFKKTLILAHLFSVFSVVFGLICSYYLNWPSGATIVLTTLLLFVISLIIQKITHLRLKI